MPVFQLDALVDKLSCLGVNCRIGNFKSDISPARAPYFERWLSNIRGGFVKIADGNIDYIGVEDIMRLGPFFNIYCLIENDHIAENDDNAHSLLEAVPYYRLRGGKVIKMGWSGGVLAGVLEKDKELYEQFARKVMDEEVRKISVRPVNFACVIETRAWEPAGLASAFGVIDRIAFNAKELLKQVHLGEDIGI
jgi:hypothetical protein